MSKSACDRFSILALCWLFVTHSILFLHPLVFPNLTISLSLWVCSGRFSASLLLLVRFSSAQSLVIIPSLSLVFWSIDLGVASSSNQWCSPRCRSFVFRASFRLSAPRCDDTTPQCVSSLCDRRAECTLRVTIDGQHWSVGSTCSFKIYSQLVQSDRFLSCYVLGFCGRQRHALL